jgi:hypothetical protein
MSESIKATTAEHQALLDAAKEALQPRKIVPMIIFLASDLAHDVTGQVFATRGNEIFLMSQPRPVRGMYSGDGWTPESIGRRVVPAVKSAFTPLENSTVVFGWDPL